ncbi:PIN-like domain-containing protein [Curtobacterium poinsettiae]|uniref:PIN-like domain-containing protein n=1 Tax=Curtobacterium poinsettiae TaxID=159612 RepID=UPI00217EF3A3|nr:PIN-like domain-containing protein [Curtobacterium flaccumfaciens]MCS6578381.1 PIN-like domain-containing protein [Curtobacterium flaccumfaciens]
MSGTEREDLLTTLRESLSRRQDQIDWRAIVGQLASPAKLDEIALVGLDTNALKRLRRDQRAAGEVLAYFESEQIPLVVPGQAAQEFWNNHETIASDLGSVITEIGKLQKRVERINSSPHINSRIDAISSEISAISEDLQDLSNPHILSESVALWDSLTELASFPFVPRDRFTTIGRDRFETKTPPGFEDKDKSANQLGDFFVWADFLLGAATQLAGSDRVGPVVLVSDDRKPDWVTSERPHPILIAEMRQVTGRAFELMTTNQLIQKVRG